MSRKYDFSAEEKTRIVQELVPGKQVTIAHLIANPEAALYSKVGLEPGMECTRSAIGILTVVPAETSIIAADLALKAAGVELAFVDRFNGTLVVTGTFSEVEASMKSILQYLDERMGFDVCDVTKT